MTNSAAKPLPPGWKRVKLGEVAEAIRGVTFPSGVSSQDAKPGFLACLTTSAVQARTDWDTRRYIPGDLVKSPNQMLQIGDILVSTANSKAIVGKSCLVEDMPYPCTFGAFVTVLRFNASAIPEYVLLALNTSQAKEFFYHTSSNTTNISNLRVSDMLGYTIPLPSMAEQRRIVARLDQQMAAVEKARAAAEEMLQNISSLKAAFLREIFALGKNLPQGWRWVPLGEAVAEDRQSIPGNSSLAKTLPYLSLEHIESNTGRILLSAGNLTEGAGRSNAFAFDDRHILYGKLRPYLNKVALPDFPGRCTTEALPLLPKGVAREYVAIVLRSDETVDYVMRKVTGSRMPRADVKDLLAMPIPLPPLAEQRRIVADLERKNAAAGRLETLARQQLADLAAMPAALLREGLAGAV